MVEPKCYLTQNEKQILDDLWTLKKDRLVHRAVPTPNEGCFVVEQIECLSPIAINFYPLKESPFTSYKTSPGNKSKAESVYIDRFPYSISLERLADGQSPDPIEEEIIQRIAEVMYNRGKGRSRWGFRETAFITGLPGIGERLAGRIAKLSAAEATGIYLPKLKLLNPFKKVELNNSQEGIKYELDETSIPASRSRLLIVTDPILQNREQFRQLRLLANLNLEIGIANFLDCHNGIYHQSPKTCNPMSIPLSGAFEYYCLKGLLPEAVYKSCLNRLGL